jgi:hypothetical protein
MIGSSIVGYKGKLRYAKEDFFRQLATKYQLIQYIRPEHFSSEVRESVAIDALYEIFSIKDDKCWEMQDVIDVIKVNPFPIAQAVGVEVPHSMRSRYIERIIRGEV